MFLPVNINGRLLVDGLLTNPVPAVPLREMGAERVVSVHLSADWVKVRGPRHVFDILGQCFSIAQDRMSEQWTSASDVVIEPEIGEFSYDDFARAPEMVLAGEVAARAAMPQIRAWFPAASPPAEAPAPVTIAAAAK
jgi:NTE family protein